MALTPAFALVALHLIVRNSPNHPLMRVMRTLTAICVTAFVLGSGIYIASILYIDAGSPVVPELPIPSLGDEPSTEVSQTRWLDWLFSNVTSPLAVLTLSLGVGGLSIISVYSGVQLLNIVEHALSEVTLTRR